MFSRTPSFCRATTRLEGRALAPTQGICWLKDDAAGTTIWKPLSAGFGLAVTAALLIVVIGGISLGSARLAENNTPFLIGLFSEVGWPLFVALFLGWLAAMGGAMSAHRQFPRPVARPQTSHAAGNAS